MLPATLISWQANDDFKKPGQLTLLSQKPIPQYSMFSIEIPGYGKLELDHFVTDFSGTLSEDGHLLPGVKEKINELSALLNIHVLTSDTFGRAKKELKNIQCVLHVLEGEDHILQKENYINMLGADRVVSLGNGNNDVRMLRASKLGISVCLREGCSRKAIDASNIFVLSPNDAFDLFLNPKRLIASLRT
jgi:soluble P-type ATPase